MLKYTEICREYYAERYRNIQGILCEAMCNYAENICHNMHNNAENFLHKKVSNL